MIQLYEGGNWPALTGEIIKSLSAASEIGYKWIYVCQQTRRASHLKEQYQEWTGQSGGLEPTFVDQQGFLFKFMEVLPPPLPVLTVDEQKIWLLNLLRERRNDFPFVFTESGIIPLQRLTELVEFINQWRFSGQEALRTVEQQAISHSIWEDYIKIAQSYNNAIKNWLFDETDWLKYLIQHLERSQWQALFPQVTRLYWEIRSPFPKILENFFEKLDRIGIEVNLLCHYEENPELFAPLKPFRERLQKLPVQIHSHPDETALSTSFFQFSHSEVSLPNQITIREFSHWLAEVEYVARKIKKEIIDGKFQPHEIAVAIPNLSDYLPAVENSFRRYGIPIEVLSGFPLMDLLPVQHLMLLPELAEQNAPLKAVEQILKSPFFLYHELLEGITVEPVLRNLRVSFDLSLMQSQMQRHIRLLENKILEEGDEEIESRITTHKKILSVLEKLHADVAVFEGPFTAGTFFELVRTIFEKHNIIARILQWGSHLSQIEVANLLEAFRNFMAALENWVNVHAYLPEQPHYDGRDLPQIFQLLLRAGFHRPLQPRNTGVKIVSLNDSDKISARLLFVAGLNDRNFPRRESSVYSELPPPLNHLLIRDQLYEDRQKFLDILQGDFQQIILSYCQWEGDSPLLPSEVILELQRLTGMEVLQPEPLPILPGNELISLLSTRQQNGENISRWLPAEEDTPVTKAQIRLLNNRKRILKMRTLLKAPGKYEGQLTEADTVVQYLKEYYRDYSFSVSALETYAYCPMRFFLQRVLKIEESAEVEDWLTPGEKGSLVHRILYRFFTEFPEQERSKDKLITIVREEMASAPIPHSILWELQVQSFIGNEVRPGLFPQFWEFEQNLQKNYPAQPRYFEYPFGKFSRKFLHSRSQSTPEIFEMEQDGRKIFLKGIVDRIELTPDGGVIIIDYKTGSYPGLKDIREGLSLQLPVYLHVVTHLFNRQQQQFYPLAAGYYLLKGDRDDQIKKELIFSDRGELFTNVVQVHLTLPGEADEEKNLQEVLNRSLQFVFRYVTEIEKGNFTHTPEKSRCVRRREPVCPYYSICRVNFEKQAYFRDKNLQGKETGN